MVRGLDYYTNTVFEVTHPALGAQDAIAAGGRYDNLVEDLGGKKTGAFGFAIGMERLLMALTAEEKKSPGPFKAKVYIVTPTLNNPMLAKILEVRSKLHKEKIWSAGINREKSLKAQMRQANTSNVAYTVIIGEDELKNNTVVLKDMSSSQQKTVPQTELISLIRQKTNE